MLAALTTLSHSLALYRLYHDNRVRYIVWRRLDCLTFADNDSNGGPHPDTGSRKWSYGNRQR